MNHQLETKSLNERIIQLEAKSKSPPEICEIDLSSALPGISEHNDSSEFYDSSELNAKSTYADKENSCGKEKVMQGSSVTSNLQNRVKSTQKFNQMHIKSIKDIPKASQKCANNEPESIRKQFEKLKSQWANLKISEKKLIGDNTILVQKIQALVKENNELKHRLGKLIGIKEINGNPTSSKRVGSWTAKPKKKSGNNKKNFESKKHSHVVVSPRMKKVGSDQALLPINCSINTKFGRRETLDVNRSSQLLMFSGNNDKTTRNSELVNFLKNDNDNSHQYWNQSPRNKVPCLSSRNNLIQNNNGSGVCNNKIFKSNGDAIPQCQCNNSNKMQNDCSQYQDQSYNYGNDNYRSSYLNGNWTNNCQTLEKELYNQVSNVVSSFFSKFEPPNNHFRQKSRSQIGFWNNIEISLPQEANYFREQPMWNSNIHNNQKIIQNSTERYSTRNQNACAWENWQRIKAQEESWVMQSTPRELMLSATSEGNKIKNQDNKISSKARKEFRSNNPIISSHLMGLNKLVRRKNNEVSPIQRDETTWLLNSATSLFDTSQSNLQNQDQVVQTSRGGMDTRNNWLLTTEETKESGYNSGEVDMLTLSADEFSQDKTCNLQQEDEWFNMWDEDIEMERVMKMNFYKFKSQNQNGIVGMWQKIQGNKSPKKSKLWINNSNEYSDKDKYDSFLNKSLNSWANLMLSNVLLSNKNSNGTRESTQLLGKSCYENPNYSAIKFKNGLSNWDQNMWYSNSLQQNL